MSINFKSGIEGGAKSENTYEGHWFTGCPRIVIPCPTNGRWADLPPEAPLGAVTPKVDAANR